MVSWWHGTAVGASAGPARTTTCTEASRPQHHATMTPCHHDTSLPLCPLHRGEPVCAAAPCHTQGTGGDFYEIRF